MRRLILSGCLAWLVLGHESRGTEPPAPSMPRLRVVPFTAVAIRDSFWSPRQEVNRTVSLPLNFRMLEQAGNLRNLELAARKAREGYSGPVYMDSDLYKALEAAAYTLATHPDPQLEAQVDAIIATLAEAQSPDGYLNSYFQVVAPDRRWTNLRDDHELYCAGHLIEAAVAHFQATGKRSLLEVAIRLADHIDSVFGPSKREGYPGHPEIELALVKLWRATGEQRYFELARFFIESRGRGFFAREHKTPPERYDGTYWQDDVPILEHRSIKGHAVRAAYLMSGATDLARETADPALLRMLDRVWRNTTERNLYITGGIGPSAANEGFTRDYDLPNLTAYQETCASIALAQWSHRLALLHGDARYADVLERALYNAVLAGVSLDGRRFFYVNPLESRGTHHRQPWFSCACCPPNVARTLAALGNYAYAQSDNALWVNLYIQGSSATDLSGTRLELEVETDYPWDGQVVLRPKPSQPSHFELRLRVPGWCQGVSVAVNGQAIDPLQIDRGYLVLARQWNRGDEVTLNLPMPVLRVAAHPRVEANAGRVALQRGPLVYCLESCDQNTPLASLFLPASSELSAIRDPHRLGGVVVVRGTAEVEPELDWSGRALYQPLPPPRQTPIVAVPYATWENRAPGEMMVWLPTAPRLGAAGGLESQARVGLSFVSGNCQPWGINDGLEPSSSGEQPPALCHWWPHRGSEEWVQYDWPQPVTISGSMVYWFDDTGRGACRLPQSWRIETRDGSSWKPVSGVSTYPIAKDSWCEVRFDPVTTTALRLVVQMREGWAAGVHEWRVVESEQ